MKWRAHVRIASLMVGFPSLDTPEGTEIGFIYSHRCGYSKRYVEMRWLIPMHGGRPWVEEWRARRIELGLSH